MMEGYVILVLSIVSAFCVTWIVSVCISERRLIDECYRRNMVTMIRERMAWNNEHGVYQQKMQIDHEFSNPLTVNIRGVWRFGSSNTNIHHFYRTKYVVFLLNSETPHSFRQDEI